MKFKNPYKVLPNYCLRVPSFSYNLLQEITQGAKIEDQVFKDLLKNSFFVKALQLASPDLLEQFEYWEKGKIKNLDKIESIKLSILKYLTRLTTRSTPFGLFAGCTMGSFYKETSISLQSIDSYHTFSRLDMGFLSVLIGQISKKKEVSRKVNYFPNSSIYRIGNQYRYTSFTHKDNLRVYSLDGAMYSDYLEKILNEANYGKNINELVKMLVSDDVDIHEANTFITKLIEKQILVSELQLSITSSNNLSGLIKKLEFLSISKSVLQPLIELNSKVADLDNQQVISYDTLYKWIKDNYLETKSLRNNTLQVDLFAKTKSNYLNDKHIDLIKNCITLFNKLTIKRNKSRLEEFKKTYLKRYDTQELPLLKVLDTEVGIGYNYKLDENTPLIDDLDFPKNIKFSKNIIWTKIDEVLLKKVVSCIGQSNYSIILSDNDFNNIETDWHDLPNTMSSIIEIVNLNGNETLIFNTIGGSSAGNLLARFSHGNADILKQVQTITNIEKEINSNKILAEIIHVPQSRTGNILRRPSLRDYEIPFLGKSDLPIENQINLDDILVSVNKNKIVLRSKRLQKEIIPRLTNAHNYTNGLPLYLFLCDLQYQNKRSSIGFYWNSIFESFPFLPRVTYKSVIISKAQWFIETKALAHFFSIDNTQLIEELSKWRDSKKMPELVQLVDGDNLLLINMRNLTSIKMLFSTIKNRKKIKLVEFLFNEEGVVKSNTESYSNQFIVSVYNSEKLKNQCDEN